MSIIVRMICFVKTGKDRKKNKANHFRLENGWLFTFSFKTIQKSFQTGITRRPLWPLYLLSCRKHKAYAKTSKPLTSIRWAKVSIIEVDATCMGIVAFLR